MTLLQFDELINLTLDYLRRDCISHPDDYKKSGEDFEPVVVRAVQDSLSQMGISDTIDYTPGSHGFPDVVIEGADGAKYGIEVKSSTGTGNSWRINGNSVLGSTRIPGIAKNMILFGKLRKEKSIFRAKEYEQCIANVVVTHSPRYLIDLDIEDGDSFFDKSKLTYSEISESDQPIKLITDYFLSIGQTAWWLAESTPAAIQAFGTLPANTKSQLMGYAFVHYPEIFSNSGTKFYRYMSWLASEKSVIDPALRDRFTAGGKADVILSSGVYSKLPRIYTKLHEYRENVLNELNDADLLTLEDDWEIIPSDDSKKRIIQWASIVSGLIPDEGMENIKKSKLLIDIITDPIG